jgi:hypothetical protein
MVDDKEEEEEVEEEEEEEEDMLIAGCANALNSCSQSNSTCPFVSTPTPPPFDTISFAVPTMNLAL